jgi:hypothetical protein
MRVERRHAWHRVIALPEKTLENRTAREFFSALGDEWIPRAFGRRAAMATSRPVRRAEKFSTTVRTRGIGRLQAGSTVTGAAQISR